MRTKKIGYRHIIAYFGRL